MIPKVSEETIKTWCIEISDDKKSQIDRMSEFMKFKSNLFFQQPDLCSLITQTIHNCGFTSSTDSALHALSVVFELMRRQEESDLLKKAMNIG